ncbi:MAG: hypothetical protein P8N76_06255 [Pirellulaceae bacterium]|nr:hypothetical protein [Pirellulaceae bacterium]
MRFCLSVLMVVGLWGFGSFADASILLGDFTVYGKQSVAFAGRTQAELTLIADAADPNTARLDNLQADLGDWADISPDEISVVGYDQLSITADGLWMHTPSLSPNGTGPGGRDNNSRTTAAAYQLFGISGMAAELNTLVGVFLSDDLPDPNNLPPLLSALNGDDMWDPLLGQTFAIGEMLSNIVIPDNASRLFLGMHDGREWINNTGSVTATITAVPGPPSPPHPVIVPEPSTFVVWSLIGICGLVGCKRLR